jgi:DNA-binding transcriptional LysR family regulator
VRGELEQAEQMAEETRSAPVGRLRINAPVSFGMNTLAPHLPRYIKEHSQVEVEPILSNRAVDQVDERYDAVFRVGELQDSGLIARVLAPYRLGVCAAPSYLCEHSNVNAGQEPPLFAGEVAVL